MKLKIKFEVRIKIFFRNEITQKIYLQSSISQETTGECCWGNIILKKNHFPTCKTSPQR